MPPLPALLGGPPVRPEGPPDWPIADADVLHSLQEAYADGSWGKYQGRFVPRLEDRLRAYGPSGYALTCGSGTFAVELALRALKVGPGDEVILAAYDYPGNFLCVHAVGARPVLAEIAPGNWNLDPSRLEELVGPAVRAVIVSHLHGGLVRMQGLMEWARERGLRVVEDAAQAPGAVVQGRKAGTWGDAGVLSFGGSKLLSAGRGGALLTGQADVHQRARLWLQRGNHVCPLSELQAAALLPQLDKLDVRNAHRARLLGRLAASIAGLPGVRLFDNGGVVGEPVYYKVGLQYDGDVFGLPRARLIAAARSEGVALDEGFPALHRSRAPSRFRAAGDLAQAGRAHDGTLVIHHPILLGTPTDVDQVAEALWKIHAHAVALREGE